MPPASVCGRGKNHALIIFVHIVIKYCIVNILLYLKGKLRLLYMHLVQYKINRH